MDIHHPGIIILDHLLHLANASDCWCDEDQGRDLAYLRNFRDWGNARLRHDSARQRAGQVKGLVGSARKPDPITIVHELNSRGARASS